MPYSLTSRCRSRCTVLVIVAALLWLPAVTTSAAPAEAPAASAWQQTLSLFAGLFADWFGTAGNDRATAADQIGSLLDPDGSPNALVDSTASADDNCSPGDPSCKGEIGSLLDPDG
jgi:hypothetical protein